MPIETRRICCAAGLLATCILFWAHTANAQSTDSGAPTPVHSNEVSASIPARDIGDARLTDHYYAFTGTPGDLLITVDGRNMNGDVDVFTAVGLRPLLKFTIYAGGSGPVTKSVYLRQREDLILRVEARTPNDDAATYRIHFGGSFESIPGEPSMAEEGTAPSTPAAAGLKKGRRVSSVGARIEEPPEPVAVATPAPEPSPEETTKPATPKTTQRNPRKRRGARAATDADKGETATTAGANTEPATTTVETPTEKPAATVPAPRRRGSRRRGAATGENTPAPAAEANTGPRLVIETNEGTLIEHYMSSVRRVTVENGLVVIVGKDGKIERVLLANVVRMSITP